MAIDTRTYPEPDKTPEELFLDFKVAQEFAKTWERAEENVALIMMRESSGTLPNDDDARMATAFVMRSGSPAYWMSLVDMPVWFRRDHLGMYSSDNYWRTQQRFPEENIKREKRYRERVAELEKAALAKNPNRARPLRPAPIIAPDPDRPRTWVPMNPNEHGRNGLVTEEIKGADGKTRIVTVDVRARNLIQMHRDRVVVQ